MLFVTKEVRKPSGEFLVSKGLAEKDYDPCSDKLCRLAIKK